MTTVPIHTSHSDTKPAPRVVEIVLIPPQKREW